MAQCAADGSFVVNKQVLLETVHPGTNFPTHVTNVNGWIVDVFESKHANCCLNDKCSVYDVPLTNHEPISGVLRDVLLLGTSDHI